MGHEPHPDDPPQAEEPGAEFSLAPLPTERPEANAAPSGEPPPDWYAVLKPPAEPPPQFSLRQFLAWITIVSIGLSGLLWLPPPIYAGGCGILTLAVFIVLMVRQPESPLFHLVWYTLLTLYGMAIIIALAAGPHSAR